MRKEESFLEKMIEQETIAEITDKFMLGYYSGKVYLIKRQDYEKVIQNKMKIDDKCKKRKGKWFSFFSIWK